MVQTSLLAWFLAVTPARADVSYGSGSSSWGGTGGDGGETDTDSDVDSDADADDDVPPPQGDDTGVDKPVTCGCAETGFAGRAGLLLAVGGLVLRRRR